jgi:hypothetical protein
MVLAQYVHGNAFILGPDLRKQDLEALPTKASAAPVPLDEELAQVEKVFLFSVQGIGDYTGIITSQRS